MRPLEGIQVILCGEPGLEFSVVETALERLGCQSYPVRSVEEMYERVESGRANVIVALVFHPCPCLLALALPERRAKLPPLVVVTDRLGEPAYFQAMRQGAFDCVAFPLDERELERILVQARESVGRGPRSKEEESMSLRDSYQYEVGLEWTGGRTGQLSSEGLPPLPVSAPPEFLGPAGVWSPEQLLLAATAGCLMTTFLAVVEISKLPVAFYHMQAQGKLEKVPGEGYRFTEITLAPEIGVAPDDVERAGRLLEKAKKNCFISNSLRAAVRIVPRFVPAAAGIPS